MVKKLEKLNQDKNIETEQAISPPIIDEPISLKELRGRSKKLRKMQDEASVQDAEDLERARVSLETSENQPKTDFGDKNLKDIFVQDEAVSEDNTRQNKIQKVGFLGKLQKMARPIVLALGISFSAGAGASAAENNNVPKPEPGGRIEQLDGQAVEKQEKENNEAGKLIGELYKLPDNPKESAAQNRLNKIRVAEAKIQKFALQKKLGFPQTKNVSGAVSPEDVKQALEVLEVKLNSAVEAHAKANPDQDKEKIKQEIYSHPGIIGLKSAIERYSLN